MPVLNHKGYLITIDVAAKQVIINERTSKGAKQVHVIKIDGVKVTEAIEKSKTWVENAIADLKKKREEMGDDKQSKKEEFKGFAKRDEE